MNPYQQKLALLPHELDRLKAAGSIGLRPAEKVLSKSALRQREISDQNKRNGLTAKGNPRKRTYQWLKDFTPEQKLERQRSQSRNYYRRLHGLPENAPNPLPRNKRRLSPEEAAERQRRRSREYYRRTAEKFRKQKRKRDLARYHRLKNDKTRA